MPAIMCYGLLQKQKGCFNQAKITDYLSCSFNTDQLLKKQANYIAIG